MGQGVLADADEQARQAELEDEWMDSMGAEENTALLSDQKTWSLFLGIILGFFLPFLSPFLLVERYNGLGLIFGGSQSVLLSNQIALSAALGAILNILLAIIRSFY